MIIIVCIDNNRGMLFNNRRQSRDRVLIERIRAVVGEKKLWMNRYSAKLFGEGVCVDEEFTKKAGEGEYCFVENVPLPAEDIEKIIVYKWNRDYPADTYFEMDLSGMKMESCCEFEGYSHECITEEIYTH